MEKFAIPTGYLFIDDYSRGQLETLSIGDYGKKHNVKPTSQAILLQSKEYPTPIACR